LRIPSRRFLRRVVRCLRGRGVQPAGAHGRTHVLFHPEGEGALSSAFELDGPLLSTLSLRHGPGEAGVQVSEVADLAGTRAALVDGLGDSRRAPEPVRAVSRLGVAGE